mmetsp:Transcript_16130/g.38666  ORF Transcript_16130/g.38666 Transcript_16130/m.38666 type:complete len:246 (+) Transcript_16130:3385-4122(+)
MPRAPHSGSKTTFAASARPGATVVSSCRSRRLASGSREPPSTTTRSAREACRLETFAFWRSTATREPSAMSQRRNARVPAPKESRFQARFTGSETATRETRTPRSAAATQSWCRADSTGRSSPKETDAQATATSTALSRKSSASSGLRVRASTRVEHGPMAGAIPSVQTARPSGCATTCVESAHRGARATSLRRRRWAFDSRAPRLTTTASAREPSRPRISASCPGTETLERSPTSRRRTVRVAA